MAGLVPLINIPYHFQGKNKMSQTIIALDSQILSSIQSCARKTQYNFIDHIRPMSTPAPLERGGLMHDVIEIFYGIKGNTEGDCINRDSELWKFLIEKGLADADYKNVLALRGNTEAIIEFAVLAGEMRATKLDLGIETCDETLNQFKQYARFYKNDEWAPVAVEETGAKILYEDEDYKFIYTFKIDRVMRKGHMVAPFDTKTGQRNDTPDTMSNQFIGYCWALDLEHLVVDKIGFQKTLRVEDRFKRYILNITEERQKEWVETATYWCMRLTEHISTNVWPMQISPACSMYSGCFYKNLCEASPSRRDDIKAREYVVNTKWDPAKHLLLETKETLADIK